MNERDAARVLRRLADGDEPHLDEFMRWLSAREAISGRYLIDDLKDSARAAADDSEDAGLRALLNHLELQPDSELIAFFPGIQVAGVYALAGAKIGSTAAVVATLSSPQTSWPQYSDALAVVIRHPAQGRLGAVRATAWLQTVLGALGLAAYASSRTIAPFALCPAIGEAFYLSTANGEPISAHREALPVHGWYQADVDDLFANSELRTLLEDSTARNPDDLVQRRLTLAARWIQLATSAVDTADAYVALGIALETLTGDRNKGAVVEKVKKRAAIFLASQAAEHERDDVYFDHLKRAGQFYDLRSIVAHGQYDSQTNNQSEADKQRDEFHRFVLDVALAFRLYARKRNMLTIEDFNKWWKRTELVGVFA